MIESHALVFFPVLEHDEVRALRALLGPTAAVSLMGFKRFVFNLQVAVAADLHALLAGKTHFYGMVTNAFLRLLK